MSTKYLKPEVTKLLFPLSLFGRSRFVMPRILANFSFGIWLLILLAPFSVPGYASGHRESSLLALPTREENTTFLLSSPLKEEQKVLTLVLRNSYGQLLSGVLVEVLSYGWGLQIGEPYHVIARGETDSEGKLAFDVSVWPSAGYRFRFLPTGHTQPKDTYFQSEADNQYRGFPGARLGGLTETQYFVVASDGLAYNDLSNGQGSPKVDGDPVGGLEHPRGPGALSSKDFLASVAAGTAQTNSGSEGRPAPTIPPPPPSFKGVQPALILTQEGHGTAKPGLKTPFSDSASTFMETSPVEATSPALSPATPGIGQSSTQQGGASIMKASKEPEARFPGANNLLTSVLLAGVGLTAFYLFWRFRNRIYLLLGIRESLRSKKAPILGKAKVGPVPHKVAPSDNINEKGGK